MHSRSYISRCACEIKSTLRPTDEVVRGFKVFADNAAIYAAYILATLEWGQMYHHYGVGMQFQFSRSGSPPTLGWPEVWPWMQTYPGNTCMLATPMSDWTPRRHGSGRQTCCSSGPTSPVWGCSVASSAIPVPWPSSWWQTSIPASMPHVTSPGSIS